MELDDFKNIFSKKPVELPGEGKDREERISSVIEAFRAEEARTRKQNIVWAGFLVILSLFYFSRLLSTSSLFSAGMMITGAGLIMGAIFTWKLSRPLPDSTVSLPPVKFLSLAEKRMRYFPPANLFKVIPILIIIGTGGGMVLASRLLLYTDNLTLVVTIWIIFYVGLCLFGFWAGRKDWKKKYGELVRRIAEERRSFEEIEGEED